MKLLTATALSPDHMSMCVALPGYFSSSMALGGCYTAQCTKEFDHVPACSVWLVATSCSPGRFRLLHKLINNFMFTVAGQLAILTDSLICVAIS